jgi:outer membrane protein assembly factor BamB
MKPLFVVLLSILCPVIMQAQFLGRTANRNNFTNTNDLSDAPQVKWRFKTQQPIVSSPIINGNFLFAGSGDSSLYALDKRTGKVLWKYRTGSAVTATVACDSTAVYFLSEDGHFYALDMQRGLLLWKFKTHGETRVDPWDYFLSSAVIQNGVVYFGSGDNSVYALDAHTGQLRWEFKTGGPVHASPTIAENTLLIGSFDGFFYALGLDGQLLWKFDTIGERYFPTGEVQFHAVAADSSVYFCARDYNVYALHIRTGKGFWVYREPGSWTSVPSLAGERLLITNSDSKRVLSLGALYGELQWNAGISINVFSSLSTTAHYGYVGALNGKLYKINLSTGQIAHIFQTDASKKNITRFYDPATQELRPNLMEIYQNDYIKMYDDYLDMGSILSTPWIENGVLYFGSTDGSLYALQ